MIVIDAMDLAILAIGAVLLGICGIVILIDRVVCAVHKWQQRRIDEAYKEDKE